jgi:hypothetical protein
VYGDNILECERFIKYLKKESISNFQIIDEIGPIDRPIFIFKDKILKKKIAFQICPYYGGTGNKLNWNSIQLIKTFNEKTDIILTQVIEDGTETKPVLAIEFVDALMAGNQGWQRSRRAIDAARAGINYLYILPLLGWERNSKHFELIHPRYLSAQTSLAQLTLSSKFGIPSLQIYGKSKWAHHANERGFHLPLNYDQFAGESNGIQVISHWIRKRIDDQAFTRVLLQDTLKQVIKEMIIISRTYSKYGNTILSVHSSHPILKPQNEDQAAESYAIALSNNNPVENEFALHDIQFNDFITSGSFFYKDAQKKTTSTTFRKHILNNLNFRFPMEKNIEYLKFWGLDAMTFEELNKYENKRLLPITYKDKKSEGTIIGNRKMFRKAFEIAYPNLQLDILEWIYSEKKMNHSNEPIFFVPIYGYKPTGDSRPDRGLLPMLWSMFPNLLKKSNTLVLVYSIYTPLSWKDTLMRGENELWRTFSEFAGAIIVDRTADGMIIT